MKVWHDNDYHKMELANQIPNLLEAVSIFFAKERCKSILPNILFYHRISLQNIPSLAFHSIC